MKWFAESGFQILSEYWKKVVSVNVWGSAKQSECDYYDSVNEKDKLE